MGSAIGRIVESETDVIVRLIHDNPFDALKDYIVKNNLRITEPIGD